MGRKKINELAIADKRYPIPLDEARLAMFSGWTKSLVFESEYFGTAEITGENGLPLRTVSVPWYIATCEFRLKTAPY